LAQRRKMRVILAQSRKMLEIQRRLLRYEARPVEKMVLKKSLKSADRRVTCWLADLAVDLRLTKLTYSFIVISVIST